MGEDTERERGCKTRTRRFPCALPSALISSVGFILLLIKTSLNRRRLLRPSDCVTELTEQPNPIRFLSDIMHGAAATAAATECRNKTISSALSRISWMKIGEGGRSSARFRVIGQISF